jgi:hypothetical protein
LLRRFDPGGRNHLEVMIPEPGGEIAIAVGAAQLFGQAGHHRAISSLC